MKLKLTLRNRLVMLMVAALIPLFGLSIFKAGLSADAAVERALANLRSAASLAASGQQRATETARQVLTAIVNVPDIQEGNVPSCTRYLGEINRLFTDYAHFDIAGADGYARCNHLAGGAPAYVGDRAYFREASALLAFVASEYFVERPSGKPVITFALPVLNKEGDVALIASATVNLTEMTKSVAAIQMPPGAALGIHDRNGTLLAASSGVPISVGEKSANPILQEAVKNMATSVREGVDGAGQRRLWAFMPSSPFANTAVLVAVSIDRNLVVGPSRYQLWLELAGLTLMAFIGGWVAWIMGGRAIVKPAAQLIEATWQLQQGRLGVRIPIQKTDDGGEFVQVAVAFNRMAESLQRHQDAFAAELARSQASQEKLQDAQSLSRIGYWQMDLATQLISWSDEIYDLLDIERSHFDGTYDTFLKWVHPGDQEALKAARDVSIRAGAALDLEYRVVTRTGEVRWIHQFGRSHADGDGKVATRRSGVIQDITQRKNAELVIARNTELLNRTGKLAQVGGWELAVDTMTPYWSDEIYRIHELNTSTGIVFEDALNFYAPESRQRARAAVTAALQDATPWDMELPLITALGQRIWVRTQGCALLEGGKVVRLVGALQDITRRYEAQEHMRLLETCISHLNDVVMIIETEPINEPKPRIVFVNDAFERQTGYSREEVLGKSPCFLRGPKTQQFELDRIEVALKNRRPVRAELINYAKGGQAYWLEIDIVPVSDAKGEIVHWVAVERDVTHRKLAGQALVESEQRYAALFEMAPVAMWVYDIATKRYLAVNQAAVQAYGYSVAEFLSMTIFDIRPEAEHEHLRQWLEKPGPKSAVWQARRKNGSIFPLETFSQPIQYNGRAAFFVVAIDKAAQLRAENEVQNYLSTLQRATDAAQAITWHQTLESTMQEIAEQARGVIGVHQAVVVLKSTDDSEISYARSLSEKYAAYDSLLLPLNGSDIYERVCESNCPIRLTQAELEAHPHWGGLGVEADGRPAMRGWLAVPLTNREGSHVGVLQLSDKYEGEFTKQDEYVALELGHLASAAIENSRLLQEVSQLNVGLEQKVAERTAALARQEALFRALSEQAPQMVWTTSPDGAGTYFNRAWYELIGGKLKDWTGYKWLAAIHPEDVPDIKAKWKIAAANQAPYSGVRRLLAKDGHYHTMAYRAAPVFDDQHALAFWIGIDADITDIKATEAALRLSNQELEAFSYSVSHDLRSPLNTVDGFSRLLAKQLANQPAGESPEKVAHYLSRIQAGVAQMGQLIEDLLSLSQVTRAQLRTEPVDLSVMSRTLLEEWQARQPERQVEVCIEKGMQAEADGKLVRIALSNLLDNALKFTSHNAQAKIKVGQKLDPAGLPIFFVQDNGAGFDMAYADKLFNPFHRLHGVAEFSGTGIGLATVSRIIKRHGGRIWADAAPGIGATFFFTLPPLRRQPQP